jgi:hypothetical protein
LATTKAFELAQLSALTTVDGGIDISGNITDQTIVGSTSDSTADALNIKDSSADILLRVRNDGVVLIEDNYLYVTATAGAYFDGSIKARGGIHSDTAGAKLNLSDTEGVSVASTTTSTSSTTGALIVGGGVGIAENLNVGGDLTVEGSTVTLNTTNLNVEDKNITLNYHATADTSTSADGSGITIQDAVNSTTDATILWDATDDKFDFSHSIAVTSTNPILTLQDTDATTTYNRTEFQNSGGGLNFNTRHSDGTFVSTDYQIGKNASGAVEHKWFIGTTARSRITSAGDAEWYEANSGSPQVGMHWDYTDGYLGIGLTAPSSDLHVRGVSRFETPSTSGGNKNYFANIGTGGHDYWIMSTSNANGSLGGGKFAIGTDSVTGTNAEQTRFTIDGSGNVGIGETSPAYPLVVKSSGSIGGGATNANSYLTVTDGATSLYHDPNEIFSDIDGTFHIGANHANGALRFQTGGTDARMDILSGGNVGIGTGTDVDELLHIEKSSGTTLVKTEVAANSTVGLEIAKTGTTTQSWRIVDGQTVNGVLEFYDLTNTTTRMAIKGNGNVGIGTAFPDALLHVSDTSPHIDIGPRGGNRGKIGYHDLDVIIGSTSSTGSIIFKNNISSTDSPQTSGDVKMTIADVGLTIHSDTYNILNIQTDSNNDQTSTDGILKITNNDGSNDVTKAEFRWDESEDLVHVSYGDHGRHISINSSGNVGIGTHSESPVHTLDVDGAIGARQVRHSVRPSLNIDFANSKELDSRIKFYRDSVATYYDSSGKLKYANLNEPRLDHDPYTGKSKGLLIEEARTPIMTYSEHLHIALPVEFSAYWKTNYAIAPNGKMDAAALFGGGNASARATTSYAGAGTYTLSVYAKNNASNASGRFAIWAYSGGWVFSRTYTWSGDTVVPSDASDTTIEVIGNGWVRVTGTWTTTGNGSFQLSPGAYANYASGDSTLFWGLNLQRNETCSTSYIPSDTKFTSRASVATYYDETGTITTAPAQTARHGYAYDGRNWVETGLILETASTNMLYHSTKGSDLYGDVLAAEAIWTMTDSSTDVTAPDGSLKTTKGVTGTSGNSWYWQVSPFSYTNGNTYTHSAWIRCAAGTTGTVSMNVYPQTGATSVTATDEWQRVSVTFVYNSGVANPYIGFVSPQHSRTFYFWGWQIEEQSQPTSYIKTLGSAVTRAADVSSSVAYTRAQDFARIDDISWYNPKESTIYGEATSLTGDSNMGGSGCLWGITDGTSTNRYLLRRNTSGGTATYSGYTFRLCDIDSNNDYFPLATVLPSWQDTEIHKMALSIKPNSQIGAADGIDAQMPSITTAEFDKPTMAEIGFAGSSAVWNGHIRKISYYPEQLPITELKALTENN